MSAEIPTPDQCPQPFWHSWVEPAPDTEVRLAAHDQDHIVQFFRFSHLPPKLREVSEGFAELALVVLVTVPRNPERTVALRKLLEAKDAAVRAAVAA